MPATTTEKIKHIREIQDLTVILAGRRTSEIYARHKVDDRNKDICFASRFDGHAGQAIQFLLYRPVRQV